MSVPEVINGVETHKGKFGYYPCSWELYRKLKRLNYLLLLAYRREKEHERWSRKLPQNRVIRRRAGPRNSGAKLEVVGPWPEPVLHHEHDDRLRNAVWGNYRAARFPAAAPESVTGLTIPEKDVERYLAEAEAWYLTSGRRTPNVAAQ